MLNYQLEAQGGDSRAGQPRAEAAAGDLMWAIPFVGATSLLLLAVPAARLLCSRLTPA